MPSPGSDFKKISFGKADAFNEDENVIINGFLDEEGFIDKIINGDKYFVFGQKGSGKSAIASHIKCLAKNSSDISVELQMLNEMDYDGFDGVIPGNEMPEIKNETTWKFLIGLKLIEMYAKSEYELTDKRADPKELQKAFEKLRILPNDLKSIIRKFKLKEVNVDLKFVKIQFGETSSDNRMINKFIDSVIKYTYEIRPKKKHFIIIDGLDSVLGLRNKQYKVLSSLIRAANTMNRNFRDRDIMSKIVVLCRNDVLDKLNDPDRSKYVEDSGIELNWYQHTENVEDTNLYKLIDLRVKLSLGSNAKLSDYLPSRVSDKESFKYILDNTRYTPRDIIQIMNKIQSASMSNGASQTTIKNGISRYSESYFCREIKDSLVGFLSNDEIEGAFTTIQRIGTTEFSIQEFKQNMPDGMNALSVLSALYNASAVGNIEEYDGRKYRVSVFRNPYSSFNEMKKICVNNGLRKALMLR